MDERLLDRDRALVDGATECPTACTSFADGDADIGGQAVLAKRMPTITPHLLGLCLGVTSEQLPAALALGKERLEADRALLFLQVVVDVRGGELRQLRQSLLRAVAAARGGDTGGGIAAAAAAAAAARALAHHLGTLCCSVPGGKRDSVM
jgi:hypothetical protein